MAGILTVSESTVEVVPVSLYDNVDAVLVVPAMFTKYLAINGVVAVLSTYVISTDVASTRLGVNVMP